MVHRVLRLGFACCCRGLALDSENWTLEQQRPNDNVIARPLLLQSPELAELVDDGGFVLQGVRIATWEIEQLMT